MQLFRRTSAPDNLLAEYRAYLVDEIGRSPRTADSYQWALRCLMKWADKDVDELTSDDLRRFKRETTFAPATVQGIVVAMRGFHEWGALEGYWPLGGFGAVKTPRVEGDPKPPISSETARLLLEACKTPNDYRVVYLGLYAGLRISESTNLEEEHWRFDRLKLRGKGNKLRSVPLHPELDKRKGIILGTRPKSAGVLQSNLERLRDLTGAKDLDGRRATSHALRRTFASVMYEQGVPYEVLAKLLGHGADVTAKYAKIPFDRMRAAIYSLDYYGDEPIQLPLFGEQRSPEPQDFRPIEDWSWG